MAGNNERFAFQQYANRAFRLYFAGVLQQRAETIPADAENKKAVEYALAETSQDDLEILQRVFRTDEWSLRLTVADVVAERGIRPVSCWGLVRSVTERFGAARGL